LKGEGRVAGTVAREASGGKSGGKVADEVANEVGAVRGSGKSFEENVAGCVGQNSFSPETLVATNTGEKPIGEVKVGDQVLAYDEASGTNGNYPVQAVLINDDPAEVFLSINGETVETTPEHPWYTEDRAWVNAGELRLGEHLRKADGSYGSVQSIRIVSKPKIMYNLTVEKAHTFFVGQQQWLVHNSCFVTQGGSAVPESLLTHQGTSAHVGNFTGIEGRSIEEMVSRVPKDWSWGPMQAEH